MNLTLQLAEKILEDFPDPPGDYKNQYGLAKKLQQMSNVAEIQKLLDYVWASGVRAGNIART